MAELDSWQLWLVLVGGVLQILGAGVLGTFVLRYVRFGDEGVAWQGHRLRPVAADARRLRLGAVGLPLFLAGTVLIGLPLVCRATALLFG